MEHQIREKPHMKGKQNPSCHNPESFMNQMSDTSAPANNPIP